MQSQLIIFLSLFNSIGTAVMWLMLGPYFGQPENGIYSIGLIAMIRQISFIFGSLYGSTLADGDRPLRKHYRLELSMLLVTFTLLVFLFFAPKFLSFQILPFWAIIRFFLSGVSFVLGFKVLSYGLKSLGNSSITHLLTTQGATLFAPIISLMIPIFTKNYFHASLIIDLLSSAVYVIFLRKLFGTSYDQEDGLKDNSDSIFKRIKDSITTFWSNSAFPWNLIQLFYLIGVSGYIVFVFHLSKNQKLISTEAAYSLCSVFYGLALWISGEIVKRINKEKVLITTGCTLIISSSVLSLISLNHFYAQAISFIIYVFGYWIMLHSTNKIILDRFDNKKSGLVRGSMVFYLSIIFGIGEFLFGQLMNHKNGIEILNLVRICCSIIILLITYSFLNSKIFLPIKNAAKSN